LRRLSLSLLVLSALSLIMTSQAVGSTDPAEDLARQMQAFHNKISSLKSPQTRVSIFKEFKADLGRQKTALEALSANDLKTRRDYAFSVFSLNVYLEQIDLDHLNPQTCKEDAAKIQLSGKGSGEASEVLDFLRLACQ
jgi:hypothetical protein